MLKKYIASKGSQMLKRIFEIGFALFALLVASPVLIPVLILVWLQDFHSPFYIAPRVGKGCCPFQMLKIRSMVVNADKSGVDSTSSSDRRITPVGKFIRAYKLDEVAQLWSVLLGYMSLVGPRPNVPREVDLYTEVEKRLLSVNPGITDFASIVFADEGEILRESKDPDLDYHQLIRPWKSRLGLFYIDRSGFFLDLQLIAFTVVAIFSRQRALEKVQKLLVKLGADQELCQVAARRAQLIPHAPPGATHIVMTRT